MAIMNRIPVLLLVEEEINDGVFSANINDKLVVKIKIKDCLDEKKNNVGTWLKSIVRPFPVAHTGGNKGVAGETGNRLADFSLGHEESEANTLPGA